ncbi:MAG: 2TM domain-containing protein [Acidimicrobiales bacterium]
MTTPTDALSSIDQAVDEREEAARRYVHQLRAFYVHAAVFVGSMAINIAVNLFVNLSAGIADEWSAWWSIWALIGWGAGIAVHGLVVRLNRPSFAASTWEQRQIDQILGS